MSVTRIRYLLDQWRLRSVAVGLQHGFGKDQPSSDWKLPAVPDPRRTTPRNRSEDLGSSKLPPS
ncbi:MAG TPA: hypothetical protein VNM14_01790 [Planctomycetota bacterium]|jgi:hypothetical protein|nr:hypothetical protein [Planctomycetota bacterium]